MDSEKRSAAVDSQLVSRIADRPARRSSKATERSAPMSPKTRLYCSAAIILAVLATAAPSQAQQSTPPAVTVGNDDLGGVVRGPNGPEAGVWVIAETTDLPTKFAKIVVTD